VPPAKKTAAPRSASAPTDDDRPDSTLVQVRHKDHDDDVNPGIVSLGYLRLAGYAKGWVEVAEATPEQEAAINGLEES
jgi:hypothetical protein